MRTISLDELSPATPAARHHRPARRQPARIHRRRARARRRRGCDPAAGVVCQPGSQSPDAREFRSERPRPTPLYPLAGPHGDRRPGLLIDVTTADHRGHHESASLHLAAGGAGPGAIDHRRYRRRHTLGDQALLLGRLPGDFPVLPVALHSRILFGAFPYLHLCGGLHWFPAFGASSPSASSPVLDRLHHLVLPAVTLGLELAAALTRYTRASLLEVLHTDYLRTALSLI